MNLSKYTDCESKQLYVFEAPIDTLSYIQLHGQKEDTTYLAMTGLKPNMVMNYVKHIKGLEKIVLCKSCLKIIDYYWNHHYTGLRITIYYWTSV